MSVDSLGQSVALNVPAARRPHVDSAPAGRAFLIAYSVLGALLAAYIVMLLVRVDTPWSALVNNWGVDAFELAAAGLCIARAVVGGPLRSGALVLGVGLLAWTTGDLLWSVETIGGGNPATPSPADIFYLLFYPLACVAIVLLMRTQVGRLPLTAWLDGVMTGLGAAAVVAAFAFDRIARDVSGPPLTVATLFAYPVADLVLLAVVVGALAMLPTWRNAMWLILALGCALDAVGDTIYLFQASADTYTVGTILDATWPAAIFLTSLAMWQRSAVPSRPVLTSRFVLPAVGATCGLLVLFRGSLNHVSRVALGLAAVTLVVVVVRLLLSFRDLTALNESRRRQALTDELTGLGNRRYLMGVLEDYFAGPATGDEAPRLALLLIDLNHFKEINDSFGHPVGDEILMSLGPRIQGILRSSDVLARLGGDEFGVVLTDGDVDYATTVAERITAQLEESFNLDVASLYLSASVGIAVAPDHAHSSAELFRCADVSMYRAKVARRPFDVYEQGADDGLNRMQRIDQLRQAIDADTLELRFQPQFDLHTGEVPAVEALLRWPHPELGLIRPSEFLPLAEEAGLIKPLTDLVLESALAQCARWHAEGHDVAVSVNLSTTSLLDVALPNRIRFLLARHRLGAAALILEITETTLMADRSRARQVVQRLHDLGLTVSIDDFGTGFSSLAYVSDLAVGELKIDRELISGLVSANSHKAETVVRTTIELGHSLGLRVVAEGVEDAATYEALVVLGCDLAQGYYLGEPTPAENLSFPLPGSRPRNVRDLRSAQRTGRHGGAEAALGEA
jgi:diguanylate cyclase (GGDEF)-like protein